MSDSPKRTTLRTGGSLDWSGMDVVMVVLLASVGVRWSAFIVCAVVDHVAQKRREPLLLTRLEATLPPVVVLIPAFNEASVVSGTVRRVLASSYPDLRVVLVDDGSTDGTSKAASSVVDGRFRIVVQEPNQGKAAALNRGIRESDAPIVITVDADTWLAPDAISWMVAALLVREADAVATNVKVGNRANLWTRWQSLEYVSGLNIDRRAQAVLGVITTVPGAASGWTREALLACGGFSSRTLAEDTDLTLKMLRQGRRIVFESRAVSFTEAPVAAPALFRQRLRWLHGNLQCVFLHSEAWWKPSPWRVRLLALPNLWFAHLGVYLLLPVTIGFAFAEHSDSALEVLAWLFAALFTVDIVAMSLAYGLDKTDWRDLPWAPSQRVGYPLFLWTVFAVVALRIVRGAPTAWNKLDRMGLDDG